MRRRAAGCLGSERARYPTPNAARRIHDILPSHFAQPAAYLTRIADLIYRQNAHNVLSSCARGRGTRPSPSRKASMRTGCRRSPLRISLGFVSKFLFCLALCVAVVACGNEGDGSDSSDGAGGKANACEPSRGASESCCLALGIDACGAGLFCAALDGRTTPSCYVERSRLDGEECGADDHCASASCHPQQHRCRMSPGAACEAALGCSDAIDGNQACDPSNSRCRPAEGTSGSLCEEDAECNVGTCSNTRCTSSADFTCGGQCSGCANPPTSTCATCLNLEAFKGSPCYANAVASPACQPANCSAYYQCLTDGGDPGTCQATYPMGQSVLFEQLLRTCAGCPPP